MIEHHDQYAATLAEGAQIEADGDVTLYASGRPETSPLAAAYAEIARLRAEVASLRMSMGHKMVNSPAIEPIGCPCPGACSALYIAPRSLTLADDLGAAARLLRANGYIVARVVDTRCTDILAVASLVWPARDGETYHAEHPVAVAHALTDMIRRLRTDADTQFRAGAEAMREAAIDVVRCGCRAIPGGKCGSPGNCSEDDVDRLRSMPLPERITDPEALIRKP